MDIASIDDSKVEGGAELHLRDPLSGEKLYNGEGKKKKPLIIVMRGSDSASYKLQFSNIANIPSEIRDVKEAACGLLASCVIDWPNGIIEDGKELEFSTENAKGLFLRRRWIYLQADAFLHKRANFFTVA